MQMIMRPLAAGFRLAKGVAAAAAQPHGLAALFLMPAIFVLVMSFTLKNTLTAKVDCR
jgi:hypothetical protein